MGKAEIRSQIAHNKNLIGTLEHDLAKLQRELEILKTALNKVKEHHQNFRDTMSHYKSVTISDNDWKGQTRDKSNMYVDNITEAANEANQKFETAIERLQEDIRKKENEIQGVNDHISSLQSAISSLEARL
ncbi:YwqH-like family protein [Staphylococcus lutrae]|uniref:DUF5082 domain-containing protein n=1 Tax=Staphylococcus lutrae TaxID=155085 RepID=A0AAC9WJ67_9STAP|nr:DUF5082 family protein [Staphylococcus lutrae]ARJ50999.1 hypothetical protein B5P37_06535 [Staphylococcus lutrae]PNZ37138.1 DUF5082 domain-containing protein [Staphylococcus lutrae]